MQTFMFVLLSVVAIFSALMVITRRNPVYSILFLVLTFFSFAGFYVMLGATFLAAVQVLVYAGAIMVLFLFVVMMLNLRQPEEREGKPNIWQWFGVVVGIGFGLVILAFLAGKPGLGVPPTLPTPEAFVIGSPNYLGKVLFTEYVLPFELAGILLLVAVVGAVSLAKKKRV